MKNALSTLINIINLDSLYNANLKYCLVSKNKLPYKINGDLVRINNVNDFVDLDILSSCENIKDYAGIGISIQGSNICAIDVDKCFTKPFDISTGDNRSKDIIEMFKDKAYIEFSFSGLGLRILFKHRVIENYSDKYYIKNDKQSIEYYQPSSSYRYVTITGESIYNNEIKEIDNTLEQFLEKYMKKHIITTKNIVDIVDDTPLEILEKKVVHLYRSNFTFQNLWFETRHIEILHSDEQGKSKESNADYQLLSLLFENITQDEEKLRLIFEQSPYYKSKDNKHIKKWLNQDYRYYKYQYNNIKKLH